VISALTRTLDQDKEHQRQVGQHHADSSASPVEGVSGSLPGAFFSATSRRRRRERAQRFGETAVDSGGHGADHRISQGVRRVVAAETVTATG